MIGYTKDGSSTGDVDPVTSTRDLDLAQLDFNLFPNPARNEIQLNIPLVSSFNWTIFNSFGEKVLSNKSENPQELINVQSLPSGIYFIQIHTDQYIGLKKWIKA